MSDLWGTREATKEEMAAFMAEQKRFEERREQAVEAGLPALERLCEVALGGSGQCHYVRRFLLAMYNRRWGWDPTTLRALDADLQDAVMAVLALDFRGGNEVHTYVQNGDELWRKFWEMESEDE